MKMDLAIRNGFLFDGAGNPARKTDIGIHDGRIARIGRIAETEAERTVDAAGLAVCPGFIDTPWFDKGVGAERAQKMREGAAASTPLKAASTAEDVAAAAVFLASPGSRHVTGETLLVDAGTHLGYAPMAMR